MSRDEGYSDWILWQLTRPAEALAITLRLSLPSLLAASPDTTRSLIDFFSASGQLPGLLQHNPQLNYYGRVELFTDRAAKGALDLDALKRFGEVYGQLVAGSEDAWSALVNPELALDNVRRAHLQAMRTMVNNSIQSNVAMTEALIETIY